MGLNKHNNKVINSGASANIIYQFLSSGKELLCVAFVGWLDGWSDSSMEMEVLAHWDSGILKT
jgi:hypothetical protein